MISLWWVWVGDYRFYPYLIFRFFLFYALISRRRQTETKYRAKTEIHKKAYYKMQHSLGFPTAMFYVLKCDHFFPNFFLCKNIKTIFMDHRFHLKLETSTVRPEEMLLSTIYYKIYKCIIHNLLLSSFTHIFTWKNFYSLISILCQIPKIPKNVWKHWNILNFYE